jgi:hypothetical protein
MSETVDYSLMSSCGHVRNFVEAERETGNPGAYTFVIGVEGPTLARVVEFLRLDHHEPMQEIEKPLKSDNMYEVSQSGSRALREAEGSA